jgi:hypothetical protein
MGEKYFAELERIWQQNRGSQVRKCFDFEDFGCPRPKALRGPDLVQELVRLAALTEDTRFKDAIFALVEHRIIDGKFNFLPWEPRDLRQAKEKLELVMWAGIHDLQLQCGTSLRRACAELAARSGWPGMSFAAAVKDLELLYRRRHLDPGELEKSCLTSIPTTADN